MHDKKRCIDLNRFNRLFRYCERMTETNNLRYWKDKNAQREAQ